MRLCRSSADLDHIDMVSLCEAKVMLFRSIAIACTQQVAASKLPTLQIFPDVRTARASSSLPLDTATISALEAGLSESQQDDAMSVLQKVAAEVGVVKDAVQ